MSSHKSRQNGQASVELLGALPAVFALLLVVWQLALTGHTAWLAANAARVAARAELVDADAAAAARSALPDGLERGVEVERDENATRVTVAIPFVHHGWTAPLTISATASLDSVQ